MVFSLFYLGDLVTPHISIILLRLKGMKERKDYQVSSLFEISYPPLVSMIRRKKKLEIEKRP